MPEFVRTGKAVETEVIIRTPGLKVRSKAALFLPGDRVRESQKTFD